MDGILEERVFDEAGIKLNYLVDHKRKEITIIKGEATARETLEIPAIIKVGSEAIPVRYIGTGAFKAMDIFDTWPLPDVETLIIPEGVVKIGAECFESNHLIKNLVLPSSLQEIEDNAFRWCSFLTKIRIPHDSQLKRIGLKAFYYCSVAAFYITRRVGEIGAGAFAFCDELKGFEIDEGNTSFLVKEGVLYSSCINRLIQYPAGKTDREYSVLQGTHFIDDFAFAGNPYLKKVTLPESVKIIFTEAFSECEMLESIVCKGHPDYIAYDALQNTKL